MSTLGTWPFQTDSFLNSDIENNPVSKSMSRDRALIERALNHKHMIETVERFEWKGLPPELNSDLIERVLYFRFKGALFKSDLGRFIFLPFTLRGQDAKTIDSYGRYLEITPVLFTGQWKIAGDGSLDGDIDYMTNRSYSVIYDMPQDTEDSEDPEVALQVAEEFANDKAVILTDSTLEVAQDYTPMNYIARPFNEQLTDILVLVNMDLISSAKMFYIVAKDEAQKEAIEHELVNLDDLILNQGKRFVVMTAQQDLKELTGSPVKDTARYFQSYQSIDNLRKGLIGESNGGTFMKQEHTTEAETAVNTNDCDPIIGNALRMRKDFCEIVNKVFGLNIEVDTKESQQENIVEPEGAQTKDRKGEDDAI